MEHLTPEHLLAAALAFCPWQPDVTPRVDVLPRAEFFEAMANYVRYAKPRRGGKRTLLDIVDAPEPYVLNRTGIYGFTNLTTNPPRIVLRADVATAEHACHELGHVVNGPGHEWLTQ